MAECEYMLHDHTVFRARDGRDTPVKRIEDTRPHDSPPRMRTGFLPLGQHLGHNKLVERICQNGSSMISCMAFATVVLPELDAPFRIMIFPEVIKCDLSW